MTHQQVTSAKIVTLQEVSLRDGLQNEPVRLPPEVRAELADDLADAGLTRIQIGAFVNPIRVPQMAETDKVWHLIRKKGGVRYTVLVLNERGLDEALSAGVEYVEIYVSASEAHSRRNANTTVDESLSNALRMIRRASREGLAVVAGVMCSFGCVHEGPIPPRKVHKLVAALTEAHPQSIGLADTTGMGTPEGIKVVLEAVLGIVSPDRLGLHLHDTYGRALANLQAGLEMGVRSFDTSVGGLGGCPFVPGAKGNVSTEQTIGLLESLGFHARADRVKLARIRERLAGLLGKPLPEDGMQIRR